MTRSASSFAIAFLGCRTGANEMHAHQEYAIEKNPLQTTGVHVRAIDDAKHRTDNEPGGRQSR